MIREMMIKRALSCGAVDRALQIAADTRRNKLSIADLNLSGIEKAVKGDIAQAKRLFETALETNPNHAPTLTNLGNVAMLEGKPELACDYYQSALRSNPFCASARFNLVIACLEAGQFEKALLAYYDYKYLASAWPKVLVGLVGVFVTAIILLIRG